MLRITFFIVLVVGVFSCRDETSLEGDRYFRNGDYEKAVEAYTEYLVLKPKDIKTIFNRGRAYEELNQVDQAIKDFEAVLKEDPNHTSALLSMARNFHYRLEDYENSVFYLDKVIALDGNNARAYLMRGKSHQKLANLNEAMSDYNSAINIDRDLGDAYIARGSLKIFLNQKRGACQDFRTAQNLNIEGAEAIINRYCQ